MKRGFTLTELLAVIIILGIIALITIPLVLRLINDARKDSAIASANSYVKQVKSAILTNSKRVSLKNVVCMINEEGDEDTIVCNDQVLEVNAEGNRPKCGIITFEDSKLKSYILNISGYRIIKSGEGTDENVERIAGCGLDIENPGNNSSDNKDNTNNIVCNSEAGLGVTELGTKYSCEVKDGQNYDFYVLSTEGDKVNLIMDRNICDDGNPTADNNYCNYPWNDEYYNLNGPTNALNVLYNATKSWNKIDTISINYEDESRLRYGNGYDKIILEGNNTQIYYNNGTSYSIGSNDYPLRARLPKLEELENANCTDYEGSCPSWLVSNLRYYDIDNGKYYEVTGGRDYWDINGYWTLASYEYDESSARAVSYTGNIVSYYIGDIIGVRPVISLPKSKLK